MSRHSLQNWGGHDPRYHPPHLHLASPSSTQTPTRPRLAAQAVDMIILPWPHKDLSPNARVHFRAKAAATKAYREQAYWLTVASQARVDRMRYSTSKDPVELLFTFCPPDKRRRDIDNMLASAKGAIDGIADALEVDDQRFGFTLRRGEPVKGGKIVVSLR
jgi:crossover junction endodeoxyribonuclease RusA